MFDNNITIAVTIIMPLVGEEVSVEIMHVV